VTAKVYNLEDGLPHVVSEVICVNCKARFVCCRPDDILLKNLECHVCRAMGYVIETGQDIDEIDGYVGKVIEYTRKKNGG
jgi:hypothetical protein